MQSVALKLIIDRENEIRHFTPEEYWSLDAEFQKGRGKKFGASFYGTHGKKLPLPNNDKVQEILRQIDKTKPFTITNVVKKKSASAIRRRRLPPAPCNKRPIGSSATRHARR